MAQRQGDSHLRGVSKYVLDADIAKCFDRINHEALLSKLGTFPMLRRAVRTWLFGIDGKTTLHSLAGIPIKRHILVKGECSPYDGDAFYWSSRLGRHPLIPQSLATLIQRQKGYCPECGRFFMPGDCVTVIRPRTEQAESRQSTAKIVHQCCQDLPDRRCTMTEYHFAEEPYEGKLSRMVLKTSRSREAPA